MATVQFDEETVPGVSRSRDFVDQQQRFLTANSIRLKFNWADSTRVNSELAD